MPSALPRAFGPSAQRSEPVFRLSEGLQGIEASQFSEVAKAAEAACPISNALRASLQIDVDAQVK